MKQIMRQNQNKELEFHFPSNHWYNKDMILNAIKKLRTYYVNLTSQKVNENNLSNLYQISYLHYPQLEQN